MDHPPGAYRTEWQLQIVVQPVAPGWQPGRPPTDESLLRGYESSRLSRSQTDQIFST